MRVLLDNNVNRRFGRLINGHDVTHVQEIGWDKLKNGELIGAAESAGFAVLITADKNMQYQQNLTSRSISIIVLGASRIALPNISPLAGQVNGVLENLSPGTFITIRPIS